MPPKHNKQAVPVWVAYLNGFPISNFRNYVFVLILLSFRFLKFVDYRQTNRCSRASGRRSGAVTQFLSLDLYSKGSEYMSIEMLVVFAFWKCNFRFRALHYHLRPQREPQRRSIVSWQGEEAGEPCLTNRDDINACFCSAWLLLLYSLLFSPWVLTGYFLKHEIRQLSLLALILHALHLLIARDFRGREIRMKPLQLICYCILLGTKSVKYARTLVAISSCGFIDDVFIRWIRDAS